MSYTDVNKKLDVYSYYSCYGMPKDVEEFLLAEMKGKNMKESDYKDHIPYSYRRQLGKVHLSALCTTIGDATIRQMVEGTHSIENACTRLCGLIDAAVECYLRLNEALHRDNAHRMNWPMSNNEVTVLHNTIKSMERGRIPTSIHDAIGAWLLREHTGVTPSVNNLNVMEDNLTLLKEYADLYRDKIKGLREQYSATRDCTELERILPILEQGREQWAGVRDAIHRIKNLPACCLRKLPGLSEVKLDYMPKGCNWVNSCAACQIAIERCKEENLDPETLCTKCPIGLDDCREKTSTYRLASDAFKARDFDKAHEHCHKIYLHFMNTINRIKRELKEKNEAVGACK